MLKSLVALLTAILISVLVIYFLNPKKVDITEYYSETYNPTYSTNNLVLSHLNSSLKNGDKIILMGSSELANDKEEAIPYNFLTNKLKTNTVGYGHAGNQSFSIACQLAQLNSSLKNSKLVILISPGWFKGKSSEGTSLDCLFDYINETSLNKIYFDNSVPDNFKDYMANYINRNFKDISNPASIISLYNLKKLQNENVESKVRYSASFLLEKIIHDFEVNIQHKYQFKVQDFSTNYNSTSTSTINWDTLFIKGINKEKANCNNQFGINDSYFSENNCAVGLPFQIDDINMNSQEFSDFKTLINLCNYYKIKPLFIIQPLNPYAYKGLEKMTPLISKLDTLIHQNGFTSLNMWTDKKEKYTKGTLTDIMHLGALGWYKVDEAIYNYFKTNQ